MSCPTRIWLNHIQLVSWYRKVMQKIETWMQSFLNGYMIPTPLAFGRNVKGAHLQLAALVQPALSWAVACAAEPQGWLFWLHHHWNFKIGQCIQTQSVCSMLQVEFLKQKPSCKLPLWDSSYYSSFCSVSPQALHGLLALPTTSRRICPNFWSNAPAASCTFLSRSCAPTPGLTDCLCFAMSMYFLHFSCKL